MSLAAMAWGAAGAMLLDALLGEPRRWHPLVGFGHYAAAIERRLYAPRRGAGLLALTAALLPPTLLAVALAALPAPWGAAFAVWALYFALGLRSLHEHVRPIVAALEAQDTAAAQAATARIVSRDPQAIEPIPATCESILENGNDGVFGALFWFACAGAPGAILYRLANTLDATWGYKNDRYLRFGWAAARLDDLLNWPAARLSALTYALQGNPRAAWRCWRMQAPLWDSPNAGPVMAAGAGALGIRLGGPARYGGQWQDRPALGEGRAPVVGDIARALALVRRGALAWVLILTLAAWRHA